MNDANRVCDRSRHGASAARGHTDNKRARKLGERVADSARRLV